MRLAAQFCQTRFCLLRTNSGLAVDSTSHCEGSSSRLKWLRKKIAKSSDPCARGTEVRFQPMGIEIDDLTHFRSFGSSHGLLALPEMRSPPSSLFLRPRVRIRRVKSEGHSSTSVFLSTSSQEALAPIATNEPHLKASVPYCPRKTKAGYKRHERTSAR
jgi:hypothetical protein